MTNYILDRIIETASLFKSDFYIFIGSVASGFALNTRIRIAMRVTRRYPDVKPEIFTYWYESYVY